MLVINLVLFKLVADELLNLLEDLNVILSDEGHRSTRSASASSTSYSVDIVLTVARDVIVDDNVYRRDIQATTSDISCN